MYWVRQRQKAIFIHLCSELDLVVEQMDALTTPLLESIVWIFYKADWIGCLI